MVTGQQFYYAYCWPPGRSVTGLEGWQVRATSPGLPEGKAKEFARCSHSLDCNRLRTGPAAAQAQLVLVRWPVDKPEKAILAHTTYVGIVRDREPSFTHGVVLDPNFDALRAIQAWGGNWVVCDGDFPNDLPELEDIALPRGQTVTEDAAVRFLHPPDGNLAARRAVWARSVILGCLSLMKGRHRRLYLFAPPEDIATLIFIALRCLPLRIRRCLTFSTQEEDLEAPLNVHVIGCTLKSNKQQAVSDELFSHYLVINTYTGRTSENWPASNYAAYAVDCLSQGKLPQMDALLARFEALEIIRSPGAPPSPDEASLDDLDLLHRLQTENFASDDPERSRLAVALASRAVTRGLIQDAREVHELITHAFKHGSFRRKMVDALSPWLPQRRETVDSCRKAFVERALLYLNDGADTELMVAVADLFQDISREDKEAFLEQLMKRCLAAGQGTPAAPVTIAWPERLKLLARWRQINTVRASPEFLELARRWLQPGTDQLLQTLREGVELELQRVALANFIGSVKQLGGIPSAVFQALADPRQPALTRTALLEPDWRRLLSGSSSAGNAPGLSHFLRAVDQSLTLKDALHEPTLQALRAWQMSPQRALLTDRLLALLALGDYLRAPNSMPVQDLNLEKLLQDSERSAFALPAATRIMQSCSSLVAFEYALTNLSRLVTDSLGEFIDHCHTVSAQASSSPVLVVVRALHPICSANGIADSPRPSPNPPGLELPRNREELKSLARICLQHLPARDLVKPPGAAVLDRLVEDISLVEARFRDRVLDLGEIKKALLAPFLEHSHVQRMAAAYIHLPSASDQQLRQEIHGKLLSLVSDQPNAVYLILHNFVEKVHPDALLTQFLVQFKEGILRLAKTPQGTPAMDWFLRFCLKGINDTSLEQYIDNHKTEAQQWIRELSKQCHPRCKKVILWNALTSENWQGIDLQAFYSQFGGQPRWLTCFHAKIRNFVRRRVLSKVPFLRKFSI
jgi:hypothetical protein